MTEQTGSAAARLRMQLNRESGMRELDKVVEKYGFVGGKRFSFKDHEFQIEIIKDTRSRLAVRKCSQVGLSELMVQKTLAMCATMQHIRVIFTLPTREMAMAFSKDRFDGALDQSEFYSGLVERASNSASQKKIGTCSLYVTGSYGANSAISVPAEAVISDEVDFSNEAVLGKLNSRLRHAHLVDEMGYRGIRMLFSTPTVDDYGVDAAFKKGHQAYYMCRCEHCEKWVLPDFFTDFVVPGLDRAVVELSREDMSNRLIRFREAWIKCSSCGRDLQNSLLNPARRQWVAKHPDTWEHSYQVFPWDVPKYNTPAAIINQLGDYPLKSDFYNFVIGLPYSDAENTFLVGDDVRSRLCTIDMWVYQNCLVQFQTVAGMDVGKTCHLTVIRKLGKFHEVVWAEKLRNTRENPAVGQVLERYDFYRVAKMCIDAGPDITLVNSLVGAREGICAVVYVRNVNGLLPIEEKRAGDVVNADRTKTMSLLLGKHNAGEILYPRKEDVSREIFEHLKTTKKVRERGSDGDMVERFVKTSDADHWVHSLNYCLIASMCVEDLASGPSISALPGVSRVRVGSAVTTPADRKIGWW